MRAVIKGGIAVFNPQGFLDGNNGSSFITLDDIEATLNLNVDMVLVSLKKVIFFNKNGLDPFIDLFTRIRKKNKAIVGFCDYDVKKYNSIHTFYKGKMNFSLFKSFKIAQLFSSTYQSSGESILLYSDDKSQRTAMAIELHDNGHNPIVAQDIEEFNTKKENYSAYNFIVDYTFLGQMGQKVGARVTGNAIVYTVTSFLDDDINDIFNMDYHKNSLHVGFRLFIFDATKVVSMNVHALNFFSKLSSAAAEYNATICFAGMKFDKTPKSFKDTMEDSGILFYNSVNDILENKELLKELGASSAANIKIQRSINKATITELPRFINATVSTIEMMTNSQAIKETVEVEKIKIENKDDKIASSIGYYGDLDGMVVLIFPQDIAKKACELLIGESTNDIDLILDTLAEFVNIVGGKIKALLADDSINVNITLPRTYQKLDDLLEVLDDRKGVQINLSFDNNKFLFFLTR